MNEADEKVSIWTKLYAIIWFAWAFFWTLALILALVNTYPESTLWAFILAYLIFVVLPFLPIYLLAKTISLQIKTKPILFVLFSITLVMLLYGFFGEERFPDFSESESQNRITEKLILENYLSPSILEIKFSPDGRRVAYVTKKGEKMIVVVDGTDEKQYDSIRTDSLTFSPDSKRLAFVAKEGDKWLVVVDGVEEKRYDGISKEPIFSPDSKKVAYGTVVGNLQFVVVDGVEEKQFDGIRENDFLFSQDSQTLAYSARKGDTWFVVVGGKEGKPYDSIVAGSIVFDSPDRLHYLALREKSIYLVEEKLKMSGDT